MNRKILRLIFALLFSFLFITSLVACDDDELPEIPDHIYTDDGGTHLPPIDYDPNYVPPVS
jgi:hypothetical protein